MFKTFGFGNSNLFAYRQAGLQSSRQLRQKGAEAQTSLLERSLDFLLKQGKGIVSGYFDWTAQRKSSKYAKSVSSAGSCAAWQADTAGRY